jgi:DNA-damage-inducible protein J
MKAPATDVVRSRISPELKKSAEAVLNQLGLSVSDGIRLFLTQVALKKSIPFEVATPNATTIAAMLEAERQVPRFSTFEELMDELEGKGEGKPRQAKRKAGRAATKD